MTNTNTHDPEKLIFSPEMKLAQLIDMDYRLLTVIRRCGISLGFGESSVADTCDAHGIDVNTFIVICAMHSFPDYSPEKAVLEEVKPELIVSYLRSSHAAYIKYGFVELENTLAALVEPCKEAQKKVIMKFLKDYRCEVDNHFEYEEKLLFPYVKAVLSGTNDGSFTISEFREHHDNIKEKLDDLKNLVMKYLPEDCDNILGSKVLELLYTLAEDLEIHTSIENFVLVPVTAMLEKRKGGKA